MLQILSADRLAVDMLSLLIMESTVLVLLHLIHVDKGLKPVAYVCGQWKGDNTAAH
jgi:hypothetical protein